MYLPLFLLEIEVVLQAYFGNGSLIFNLDCIHQVQLERLHKGRLRNISLFGIEKIICS